MYAQMCCVHDESCIAALLARFPQSISPSLRQLVEDHHIFDALAQLQQQEGDMTGARSSALLHLRTSLLDLRSFAASLLPFFVCEDGCNGSVPTCTVADCLQQVLHGTPSAKERSSVDLDLLQHVQQGQQLRERVLEATRLVESLLPAGEDVTSTMRTSLPPAPADAASASSDSVIELCLGLLAEASYGKRLQRDAGGSQPPGQTHSLQAAGSGGSVHAQQQLGTAWEKLVSVQLDAFVRQRITAHNGPDKMLLQVLEALASTQESKGSDISAADDPARWRVWNKDAVRLQTLVDGRGQHVTERQAARHTSAQALAHVMQDDWVHWQMSVLYAQLVLRAQRALRHTRESVMSVMREEYFEVDGAWRRELHQPVLLQHEDLAV